MEPLGGEGPTYDVEIKLVDVEAEHGFRIDEVSSSMDPQALSAAFATAYAKNRARVEPEVLSIAPKYLPTLAQGGATSQYRVKGEHPNSVEQVWVAVKPSSTGVLVLYHTTRCNLDDVNPIKWFHLRSTCMGQHRWDVPESPRSPIWPTSEMATPTAKLELTESEWAEAVAKARELPELGDDLHAQLVPFFTSVARTDNPPASIVIEKELQIRWDQLSGMVEPVIADVFLRNLARCRTALDLRAWAWECIWAIGNRQQLS